MVTRHQDQRHQTAEGENTTYPSLFEHVTNTAVDSPTVLRHGQQHLTSLPTETPALSQDSKVHHPHATGTSPTYTDHKLRQPRAATEELDEVAEALAADLLVQADPETANGSTASTFQDHPTHA